MSNELTQNNEPVQTDEGVQHNEDPLHNEGTMGEPRTDSDSMGDTDSTTNGQRMPEADSAQVLAGEPNEVDALDDDSDRPRVSTVLSITAVAFAVAAMALQPTYAIPGVLLGAMGVVFAVVKRRRSILGPSVSLALFFVLLHGVIGGSTFGTLAAAGLLVLAWDQVDNAFDLDAHLGPDATVVRGEIAHALYSFAVVAIAGGATFAIALLAENQRPLPALVLLLLGTILLVSAVRNH